MKQTCRRIEMTLAIATATIVLLVIILLAIDRYREKRAHR